MRLKSPMASVIFWTLSTHSGSAGIAVGGATEWTQILNNLQLVELAGTNMEQVAQNLEQISHQATQIENQLDQYKVMLQNLERLPENIWGNAVGDLNLLQRIVAQGEGIAFSLGGLDDVLAQRFPSYANLETGLNHGLDFSGEYASWSQANRDTIAGTLASAGLTAQQFESESQTLSQLHAQSASAIGQMQALQTGHAIASQQVAQIQKLRALIAQQTVMMGTWYQSEQTQSDLAQARRNQFFSATLPALEGRQMQILGR